MAARGSNKSRSPRRSKAQAELQRSSLVNHPQISIMGRISSTILGIPEDTRQQGNSTLCDDVVEKCGEAAHVSGGGVSAIRALRIGTPGNLGLQHYGVARRELPLPLIELVCEHLSLKYLPKVRCLSTRFQQGLSNHLSRNPKLQADFYTYLRADKVKQKRVWVAVRVKPQEDGAERCVAVHHNRVTVTEASSPKSKFFFDGVFNQSAAQHEVWMAVSRPVLSSILDRKHVCFFAYGQTGSGKTHTMFGDREVPGSEGIAFRAVRSLAALMNGVDVAGKGFTPIVEFSFLEVYNEKAYDLLAGNKQVELVSEREVKRAGSKYHAAEYSGPARVVAKGLSRRKCDLTRLEEQVGDWVHEGASTRTVGKTVFNEQSSRSHAVATIHIIWEEGGAETRMYLVDLAGSERAGQYALSAEQLQQGVNINKSLSTMARVITVLSSGSGEHVPYRDSTLTWLLSDAITGINARTFMIAAINPQHGPETVSTLQYAQQYSSLQSNQEEINKVGSTVRKSLASLQQCKSALKYALKDTQWTVTTLKAQMQLNQREEAKTRHLFGLLRERAVAEERHARCVRALEETKNKSKQQEAALIISD